MSYNVKAHIPGAQNTVADYLSRLEADPNDNLVMKITEDVQTQPIEINVQSAGVTQEEQISIRLTKMKLKNNIGRGKKELYKTPPP